MYLPAIVHRPQIVVYPPNALVRWLWLGEGPAVLCHTPNTSPPATSVGQPCSHIGVASLSRGGRSKANPELHWLLFTWLLHPYRTDKIMAHYANACYRTKQCSLYGRNGCTSCKVPWRMSNSPAHTMNMTGHSIVAWPIQAGQLHVCQGSAAD